MVRLISDGGSIIVGRRTASWVWGQFEVTLPEGDQQAPQDDRLADGYVYRPDDRETGRFDLAWVRADVNLNMNAEKSDLEATLDAASRRTDGDVFYGREISGQGLGRWRPGVDFQEGSLVEVLLWGKILELPVTSVRPFSTPDEPVGWAVQVGGQPLRDPEAQRKRIHDLWTQIMTERRRALAEERRLAEQAATDRQQTQQIEQTQGTLSYQQRQLRTHSAEMATWSGTMTGNFDIMRGLFNELRLQKAQWDVVANLFEHYHDNSGVLRTWAADSHSNIQTLIQQLDQLSPPPQPPTIP